MSDPASGRGGAPLRCALCANYHTHTVRCGHASGTEREYIENALSAGMKTLGFSDHAPYPFPDGFRSTFRMGTDSLPGYVETLLALREEYRGRIEILLGLEAEYYPARFGQFLELISPYPLDYLILGQHYLENEYDGTYCGAPHGSEADLARYADQVTEGLSTGKFAYLAHPDLFNFTGNDAAYRKHMTRLCLAAKELGIPLEINFLGYSDHRCYPSERFFRIVAEVGNTVIFGCDAHRPAMIPGTDALAGCSALAGRLGLVRTEAIRLTLRGSAQN